MEEKGFGGKKAVKTRKSPESWEVRGGAGRLDRCLTSAEVWVERPSTPWWRVNAGNVLRGFGWGLERGRSGEEGVRLAVLEASRQPWTRVRKPQGLSRGVLHTRSGKRKEEYRSIGLGVATGPLVAEVSQASQKK